MAEGRVEGRCVNQIPPFEFEFCAQAQIFRSETSTGKITTPDEVAGALKPKKQSKRDVSLENSCIPMPQMDRGLSQAVEKTGKKKTVIARIACPVGL